MFFIESLLPSFRQRKHRYWFSLSVVAPVGALVPKGTLVPKDTLIPSFSPARSPAFMVLSVCAYKKYYKFVSAVCNYTEKVVSSYRGRHIKEVGSQPPRGGQETRYGRSLLK
jgi:hypothetical protein